MLERAAEVDDRDRTLLCIERSRWRSARGSSRTRPPCRRSGFRPPTSRSSACGCGRRGRRAQIPDIARNRRPIRTCRRPHGGPFGIYETTACEFTAGPFVPAGDRTTDPSGAPDRRNPRRASEDTPSRPLSTPASCRRSNNFMALGSGPATPSAPKGALPYLCHVLTRPGRSSVRTATRNGLAAVSPHLHPELIASGGARRRASGADRQ